MNLMQDLLRDRPEPGAWLYCKCGAKVPEDMPILSGYVVGGECTTCWERRVLQEDGPAESLLEGGTECL